MPVASGHSAPIAQCGGRPPSARRPARDRSEASFTADYRLTRRPADGQTEARAPPPPVGLKGVITSATMTSANVATAVTFVEAAHRGDLSETSRLIGDGYVFIDHLIGSKAETVDALQQATSDFAAWSSWDLHIDNVMETTDGTVIVQFVATGTHTGTWRGIDPTGKRAVFAVCDFFRFDSLGRVISEEVYGDRFSIMEQLGVLESNGRS